MYVVHGFKFSVLTNNHLGAVVADRQCETHVYHPTNK